MRYYLPTKKECDDIVKSNDAFISKTTEVEGCKVAVYDYRLASLSDFIDYQAFELRGICFVEQPDGSWKRNILMNKFFNIGQTDGWLEDDVKDKKIVSVQNKEDGSICSFVKFPNGKIRAKSKTSFISDQAIMAQKYFDSHPILQEEISYMLDKGLTPIFELVGPENQIVLEYQNTELILLQIRREDGSYESTTELKWVSNVMGVQQAEVFPEEYHNLDYLLRLKETNQENVEGWVITFSDGQMAKIKTVHYLSLHSLIGPDAFRENLLVKTIVDGNIDDVISALVPGEKKTKLIEIDKKVSAKFNRLVKDYFYLRDVYFNTFQEDRKEFALAHRKHPLFGAIMKTLKVSIDDIEETAEVSAKEYILRQCKTLGAAKEFVESL